MAVVDWLAAALALVCSVPTDLGPDILAVVADGCAALLVGLAAGKRSLERALLSLAAVPCAHA